MTGVSFDRYTRVTPMPKSDEDSLMNQFAMFGIVLGLFVGSSAVSMGLGWFLWKKMGFPWWILLVTASLGIFLASIQVVRYQRRLEQRQVKR